ncbi:MAG: 50S ribosomal protein L11 methyltransferase [Clostridia bacterium]|nr:50S ribosomal protein L11 methyltransferase [Clostridia bacterium]
MDWTDLQVIVPQNQVDLATSIACMITTDGVYVEDYSDLETAVMEIAHVDLIDEKLLASDRSKAIVHIYVSPKENPLETMQYLEERFQAENLSFQFNTAQLKEEDWANNWKQYFHPLPVGEKLLICPSWETPDETVVGNRSILTIDPGMAFGTGGHDTTRLVLETLEETITPGVNLLDIGCGSGILSMAGLLLGAQTAFGIDINETAVKTAIENGQRNHMAPPAYTIVLGDLARDVVGTYQVVVANIVADAIIQLSPDVPRFLARDGVYIVSGIIDTREEDVTKALTACGFTIINRKEHGGWLCLVTKQNTAD